MVGVVLAGGSGSRMTTAGLSKPAVSLGGRPMIDWPLGALQAVCARVAVVCKASTELPALRDGVERWDEPDVPRHPLTGIVFGLETAGVDVLVCAADMPFVDAPSLWALVAAANAAPDAVAVVAEGGGRLQPTLAVYRHAALRRLGEAVVDAPLTRTVEGLEPVRVSLASGVLRNVNTPAELATAESELS